MLNRDGTPKLDAKGVPRMRDIIPDRVVRNMLDNQIGPSGRYVVDTAIVSPEAKHHIRAGGDGSSATTDLAAAGRVCTPSSTAPTAWC